jgi:hypothetical protein
MGGRAGGVAICALAATLLAAAAPAARPHDHAAVALNILPPGESGTGGRHATDQLRLYDALTPLRGNVTAATLRRLYKPETLGPSGKSKRESTPRRGLRILRDRWGVAHVYGKTALDTMWGAGWVAAEDRGLILQLIRGPGRIAALDGPAYDQSREFVPSASTEAELAAQYGLVGKLGKRGRQLVAQINERAWREARQDLEPEVAGPALGEGLRDMLAAVRRVLDEAHRVLRDDRTRGEYRAHI